MAGREFPKAVLTGWVGIGGGIARDDARAGTSAGRTDRAPRSASRVGRHGVARTIPGAQTQPYGREPTTEFDELLRAAFSATDSGEPAE